MSPDRTALYLEALKLVNLKDLARKTGRGYRTLHAYKKGEFKPSEAAIRELIEYLKEFQVASENLEATLKREEGQNE